MILRFPSPLNSPPFVAAAGTAVLAGMPFLSAASAPIFLQKGFNALAFALNCAAVSVPGRIDEAQDVAMRQGKLNPAKPAGATNDDKATSSNKAPLAGRTEEYTEIYSPTRGRTLVSPSGWAFAIWGPIYLGEAVFVASQYFLPHTSALTSVLPQVTVPFVAANIFQSLWCASFRPEFNNGLQKYISVGMLAGSAISLSRVHAVACSAEAVGLTWLFAPMTLHFGWTTAATLVNLNGSFAMDTSKSDQAVIALGHASALTATLFGVGVTLARQDPIYGITLAWALAGCGDGMKRRITGEESSLRTGAKVQRILCWAGSAACLAAAFSVGTS